MVERHEPKKVSALPMKTRVLACGKTRKKHKTNDEISMIFWFGFLIDFWMVFEGHLAGFWEDFSFKNGSKNRWKKGWAFLWIFDGFWGGFGSQNGIKNPLKNL